MPVTPVKLLPYPAYSDPADVPQDMQELAQRTEDLMIGDKRGSVGFIQIYANANEIGTLPTAVDGTIVSATIVAGRTYRMSATGHVQSFTQTAPGLVSPFLFDNYGVTYVTAGIPLYPSTVAPFSMTFVGNNWSAGVHNFQIGMKCDANTAHIFAAGGQPTQLVIDDITTGP